MIALVIDPLSIMSTSAIDGTGKSDMVCYAPCL